MHPIETPDKTFHDGNGVSELGTILPAWWLNQIQAELLAVLTAAGIQPNKAKTNQLADAIKQIFRDGVVNSLSATNTDKPLSAAMGRKLAEEKIPNTTQDFMRTLGEFNPGKSGFVRTNGGSLNGNSLPSMEIHIGNPSHANGAYSRGIGFAYGAGWGIYTTAWGATGNYLGYKEILTEGNGVMLTGNQTVGGKKTFSESTDFAGGLRISGNNTEQWSGFYRGNADWYWNNPIAGKALQFNDDGTLALSGDKILLYTDRSNAVDLDRDDKIATSKAVKIVNDKIEQAAPSGEVAYFAGRNAPAGWLKANGAAVSRTTYADLFAAIGTNYGAGDGRTTFNLPDLRGEFIRGWDDGRGIDRGRALGSAQGDAIRNITGKIGMIRRTDMQDHIAPSGVFSEQKKISSQLGAGARDDWLTITEFSAANVVPTADENRPRNIDLLACIKI